MGDTVKKDTLNITEVFTSIQGEGLNQGEPSHFIRLHGCSMKCPWCDSKYSWTEKTVYYKDGINSLIDLLKCEYPKITKIVISGGEPMEQDLSYLLSIAHKKGFLVDIETNGIVPKENIPSSLVKLFIVSPKFLTPKHVLKYTKERMEPFLQKNHIFKFVVETEEDFVTVQKFVENIGIQSSRVWIMPKGTKVVDVRNNTKKIVPWCLSCGYNVSDRQHIMVWGNKRGV